jgi:hypothetical protein
MTAVADPTAIQAELKYTELDVEVTQPPEIGRWISAAQPLWRREWGISADEN